MATKFPIIRARGKLPGIAPAARADIDVRTGERELARGISALGEAIEKYELMQVSTQLSEFKRKVREEHSRLALSYDGNLDPTTFKAEYEKSLQARRGLIPKNRFAAREAQLWLNDRIPIWEAGVEKSRQLRVEDNFRAEGFELKVEGERTGDLLKYNQHLEVGKFLGIYGSEEIEKLKQVTLDEAERNLINSLIRDGQTELAFGAIEKSQLDEGEKRSLENTARIAQEVRENQIAKARQDAINKVTSDTIREYFNGELTVVTLNERHEKGLIRDSEFKFMMNGLTQISPDNSDAFAIGRIRRANADFAIGAIGRGEADRITLENFAQLDAIDRESVVADLEDIEARIIATAKSNAYDEGRGLMSQRFVGIQSEEELIDLFKGAGLTEDEKKRINRRWTAEVNNRDLYERAIDERFKEMRKEGISDISKYKSESLKILLQYQRRNRLSLVGLEEKIREEQRRITGEPPPEFIGPPVPTLKSIDKMTTVEKQKELERIRELKKLAK